MKKTDKSLDFINFLSVEIIKEMEGKPFWKASIIFMRYLIGLAVKVRISEEQIAVFKEIDSKLFLGTGNLCVLTDFKIKTEEKKRWGKKVTRHYLTGVSMWFYNKRGNYWARVINPPLFYLANTDLLPRRQQWEDIIRSLNVLGYEVAKPTAFDHNDYY